VIGNLCDSLCSNSQKYDSFGDYKLSGCRNNGNEFEDRFVKNTKSIIFYKSDKTGDRIVLKSHKHYFQDTFTIDVTQMTLDKQLEILSAYFKSTLTTNFGIETNETSLFEYIKMFTFNNDNLATQFKKALTKKDTQLMATLITNLMSLLNQNEYLFYTFFKGKKGVAKINGTCGNYYAVEYAESLDTKISRMKSTNERLELASKFIELADSLDTIYLPKGKPIQMCDVKLDNFGLSKNENELILIDTDMLHIDEAIFYSKVCDTHSDCDFFDCLSYCDPAIKKCYNHRINNNLQTFCSKILYNSFDSSQSVIGNRNVDTKLGDLLNVCSNPGFFNNTNIKIGANKDLVEKLLKSIRNKLKN
jgi:hypothetical protein